MAIDQAEFGLQDHHPFLRILEPPGGDPAAQPGEQRRRAALQPDEGEARHHGQADADFHRHGQSRSWGAGEQDPKADDGERDLGEEFRL